MFYSGLEAPTAMPAIIKHVLGTFSKNAEGCRDSSITKKPQKLGIGMAVYRQDRAYKD